MAAQELLRQWELKAVSHSELGVTQVVSVGEAVCWGRMCWIPDEGSEMSPRCLAPFAEVVVRVEGR